MEQIVKSDVEAFGSESELEYSSDKENDGLHDDYDLSLYEDSCKLIEKVSKQQAKNS